MRSPRMSLPRLRAHRLSPENKRQLARTPRLRANVPTPETRRPLAQTTILPRPTQHVDQLPIEKYRSHIEHLQQNHLQQLLTWNNSRSPNVSLPKSPWQDTSWPTISTFRPLQHRCFHQLRLQQWTRHRLYHRHLRHRSDQHLDQLLDLNNYLSTIRSQQRQTDLATTTKDKPSQDHDAPDQALKPRLSNNKFWRKEIRGG